MTAREIRNLVQLLPPDDPYFLWGFRERAHSSSLTERRTLALNDPAFGCHLAKSYADAELSLPMFVKEDALLRANRSLREPGEPDINVAFAQMLNLPENSAQRDLMRALFICEDSTTESVAQHCSIEVDVARLFACLFWNCFDRRNERPFIARICQVGSVGAKDGFGSKLLTIAYQVGKAESVLIAAGVTTAPKGSQKLYEQIHHGLLASAAAGLAKASVSKSDNPALEPVLRIIAARKKQNPTDQQVITGPRIGESLISSFNEIVPPEIRAPATGIR